MVMCEPREPKGVALVQAADGSEIRLAGNNSLDREVNNLCANADFYDPIPDLWASLGDAFQTGLMLSFYTDRQLPRWY